MLNFILSACNITNIVHILIAVYPITFKIIIVIVMMLVGVWVEIEVSLRQVVI